MTRLLLAALALASLACAPEPMALNAELHISPKFSAEQQEAIIAAADEWHAATRGRVNLRPVISDSGPQFDRVQPYPLQAGHLGATLPPDWVDPSRGTLIHIDVKDIARTGASVKSVAMHEIGHALAGDEHQKTGLMLAASNCRWDCLDDAALRWFCDERGCPDGFESTCASD